LQPFQDFLVTEQFGRFKIQIGVLGPHEQHSGGCTLRRREFGVAAAVAAAAAAAAAAVAVAVAAAAAAVAECLLG
jgi:hypothetical protein